MAKRNKPSKSKLLRKKPNHVWLIAYINRDFLHRLKDELRQYKYKIDTYVPTVKVLKKKSKGVDHFEFIPLLFNYGFFRVKYDDACNPDYLMELRNRITSIYAWVKDPANISLNIKRDNTDSYRAIPAAAIARDKEVASLIESSEQMDIFSADDINGLEKGDLITLKGYPFDNMPAEFVSINKNKKEIRVKLLIDSIVKEMTVSFENVFYTVYQGYDDSLTKGENYDEMMFNNPVKVDKVLYKNISYEVGE